MFNLKINVIASGGAFILSFLLGLISGSIMPMLVIWPVIFAFIFFVIFSVIQILVNRFLPELHEGSGKDESSDFLPGTRINITEDEPMPTPMDYSGDGAPESAQQSVTKSAPSQQVSPSYGARPDELDKDLGDISQLSSITSSDRQAEKTGIDQDAESGYNEAGEEDVPDFEQADSDSLESMDSLEAASNEAKAPIDTPASDVPASFEAPQPQAEKKEAEPAAEMPEFFFGNSGGSSSDELLPDLDSMAGAFSSASSGEDSEASDYPVSMSIAKETSGRTDIGWSEDYPPKDIASGVRTILNKDKEA